MNLTRWIPKPATPPLLPRGKIRLSAPLSFGTIRLAPRLADFAKAYPEIALEVHFSDRLVNLVDEGFDMAVRVGKPRDTTLIARKLCSSQLIVAAAPTYLAAQGTPQTPQDLTRHDCLIDTNYRDPKPLDFCTKSKRCRHRPPDVLQRLGLHDCRRSRAWASPHRPILCWPTALPAGGSCAC